MLLTARVAPLRKFSRSNIPARLNSLLYYGCYIKLKGMAVVTYLGHDAPEPDAPVELLKGKRHLTSEEIHILESNHNINVDPTWKNFYVSDSADDFNPDLIRDSYFEGFTILGKLKFAHVQHNDLKLVTGIFRSNLRNTVTGDDNVIQNVKYMDNYRLGNRVMLFNIDEICCTNHAKFGNGILKEGEPESHRIRIGVGNENEGRAILPFESMIPADAYIWSHYREDNELLARFQDLTEYYNDGKLNTFGTIGDDTVIKNTSIVKDVKIGTNAYIKGAFKLKNLTILSSENEPSQIGEGVEMVNGIMGYASKAFYQVVAVRFVIGRNCQLKYGARVLNSVLGDNSTVSCCEILNNLIYPFHEQHHNSSFLIATTIQGQSNIAAGATIGSNHNSRSPDGEIFAKRGFWPGLCSDFKHNSNFASFVLVSKGSYKYELDIRYPFCLVSPASKDDEVITIIPAWLFLYDMFAVSRNNFKFKKRDKRVNIVQHIETDPMAPDTMQEILSAIDRLIALTALKLPELDPERAASAENPKQLYQMAKDYMHHNEETNYTLHDDKCQKKYGGTILKPAKAYKTYRKVIKYFAARTILEFCKEHKATTMTKEILAEIKTLPLYTEWENVGGQIIPSEKVRELLLKIKYGEFNSWDEVHTFYDECERDYSEYKVRYAVYLLEWLYSRPAEEFTVKLFNNIVEDVSTISDEISNSSYSSREKDYQDYYRQMVYHSVTEMENVLGSLQDNDFLKDLKATSRNFNQEIAELFRQLTEEAVS